MAENHVLTITEENYEQEVLQSDIPVLIDFWASWCAPCRMISPTIAAIAQEMNGRIKVGKINVDEQPNLASSFRVMSIPTLTLSKKGDVIWQTVGVKMKDVIIQEIEAKI